MCRAVWLAVVADAANLVMILVMILMMGCGASGARVSGRVTLDGAMLESGAVQFHPVAGGPAAYGSIGPGGRFTLAVGSGRGPVPTGRYIATVVAVIERTAGPDAAAPEAIPLPITPPRYGDVKTSGLEFEFSPGGNDISLDLESEPAAGDGR